MSDSTTFVRLFVGFLLGATGVHASCPIEVSPPHVVVRHGDPVSSTCSTSEKDFEGIGWEATEEGTGLELMNRLNWTVNKLTNWDVSAFCYINPAENSTFGQCNVKLDIVLYTFPETIDITSTSGSNGVMREMDQHNFTCDIDNIAPVRNLTVRWYKGDTLYYTDTLNDPSKKPVSQSSVLSFTPSREDNGATFRCEAHMDLGPEGPQFNLSSKEISIKVNFGPDVGCSAPALREGETLKERCPVTGNPTPIVTWLKDGQLIDPAVPLTREMAGWYTIKAEGLSLIENNLQVLVLYGPELTCPSTYTALEYAPHNLTCVVEGYPQPEINWYKDGDEVELPENLTRRDTGQYLIIASNNQDSQQSNVSHTIEITVIYPPSPIVELEDSEVDVGSTVWLKCSSTGNPRPKYLWNYYQAANVREENEDGVSRLVIPNAMAYNMGSYTCHAWNDRGNVSKTVRVTVKGAEQECPIEITPDRMVIQYQGSRQNATCKPTSTGARNLEGEISWEVLQGHRTNSASLFVNTREDWDLRPVCAATFKGIGPCRKRLDFTLYKTPDSVSIHSVDNSTLVVEGTEFQLQCYITNVAPVRSLTVQWYRGNETFQPHTEGSMRVTSCPPGTRCNISEIQSPQTVLSTVNVTLNRTDNGAEFRCAAQLDLGLNPRPNMMSSPLKITVHYKPTINTTKLPKTIPVFNGYPEELICEADGHPAPVIRWFYVSDKEHHLSKGTLIVSEAGLYTCNASNEVDTVSHEVEVILKEDYLPLIAGFVAVTVVIISVIFVFIYSIYYKNTKMRRYSLKNPKLSTHNGNVAHNGWDMQFPMTRLS